MCVRVFVVQQIPDSNLLMLVVQADCDCSRQYLPLTTEPKEVKYILLMDPAGVCSTQVFYPIKLRLISFRHHSESLPVAVLP